MNFILAKKNWPELFFFTIKKLILIGFFALFKILYKYTLIIEG